MAQQTPKSVTDKPKNIVAGGTARRRFLPRTWRARLLLLVVVVVLILVAIFLYNYVQNRQVYLQAGNYSVTRGQYQANQPLAAADDSLSGSTYMKRYETIVKDRAAAAKLHLQPLQSEINQAAKKHYHSSDNLDSWEQLNAYDYALPTAAKRQEVSAPLAGAVFVFPFTDKATNASPAHATAAVNLMLNRQYALAQANNYYGQLTKGKITATTAIQKINADQRLNTGQTAKYSRTFTANDTTWQSNSFYGLILSDIQHRAKTGWNAVTTTVMPAGAKPWSPQELQSAPGYVYFYHLTAFAKTRPALWSQFTVAAAKQPVQVHVPVR